MIDKDVNGFVGAEEFPRKTNLFGCGKMVIEKKKRRRKNSLLFYGWPF